MRPTIWGLLWVHDDMSVTVEKEATAQNVPLPNRVHLLQNIAAAAKRRVLAGEGIGYTAKQVVFVKQPRRHRKAQELRFDFRPDMP